jgi:hypothetical protein
MTDAELLERLALFINELRWIQRILRAKRSRGRRSGDSFESQDNISSDPDDKLPVR